MPIINHKTNRVDLLARAALGSDSDAKRREIIRWNAARFGRQPTFWLDAGEFIWTEAPGPPFVGAYFLIDDRRLLANGAPLLLIPGD